MEVLTEVLARIEEEKIVPVIKLERPEDAVPLADALAAGSIGIAEITFRTRTAAESIRLLRRERPDMLIGAGTVLTLDQLEAAVSSGAGFIMSPGFNPVIVQACISRGIPIVPGVNNPSHIEAAIQMGLGVLKFFPAELSGGIEMLKAFGSVYSVDFIPTGGLHAKNVISYLKLMNVAACGGSWMVKDEMIRQGNFNLIQKLSAEIKSSIAAELQIL
ncbi:MAG: bifunctional 4-hydroxy-2-oxoglutarate aldolase/2-dehydro-3-deoxy-phosphogluconate aldolase [Spirochaetia bacterium]|nr:bifunctional 4-hydroxy-2-oxoglutarate aldolase/2-dehydro-3-deoxy-phosphogluconate aldolase [Spirochaetia bacterium]